VLHNQDTCIGCGYCFYACPFGKQGGGFLHDNGENPPARKFNAGQKFVFWGVTVGGLLLLLASGLSLMFPFYWLGYGGTQTAQIVHACLALRLIALIFGHIYIGTVGMEGAFDAMWSGRVDRNWAKEHHSLWYERKIDARRDAGRPHATPAE
jgi:formate dehydrogenase subunit gamma